MFMDNGHLPTVFPIHVECAISLITHFVYVFFCLEIPATRGLAVQGG